MKDKIKQLRVRIDGLYQLTDGLNPVETHIETDLKNLGLHNKLGRAKSITKPAYINSPEIQQAANSLRLAKAWLGKLLGSLGEETPYKNDGKRKSVEDIEETADRIKYEPTTEESYVGDENKRRRLAELKPQLNAYRPELKQLPITPEEAFDWANKNHIEKVDWLREEIAQLQDEKEIMSLEFEEEGNVALLAYLTHLREARFWLGFELERVREE